jgi:hypothetical protein
MPIIYNSAVIEAFFGFDVEAAIAELEGLEDRILGIDYAGATLKYSILLHLDKEIVGVSGDVSRPFGADSIFEFYVPCSLIVAGPGV